MADLFDQVRAEPQRRFLADLQPAHESYPRKAAERIAALPVFDIGHALAEVEPALRALVTSLTSIYVGHRIANTKGREARRQMIEALPAHMTLPVQTEVYKLFKARGFRA